MKKVVLLVSLLLGFQVYAAPTVSPAASPTGEEEITLEDLQAEFLKEADTLVVDEDDVNFLDEEIEQKAVATGTSTDAKTTVKAPTTNPVKK
jgi:hypothetical protein